MSFSSDLKKELISTETLSSCCQHSEAYGLLVFGRTFSNASVSLSTEYTDIARYYADTLKNICHVTPEISGGGERKTVVSVKKTADRRRVLETFGHSAGELTLRINRSNFASECCFASFLRGAFLSCGTINSPDKHYHLEFVVPFLKLSNDLFSLLDEMSLEPKHVMRKSSHVIYFKDSGRIEDLLTTMGAVNSSLELMGIKIEKDLRNRVNRRVNFETANIERSVNAAGTQCDAIELIERFAGLESLPDSLKSTAIVRKENPDASLSEMEELMDFAVSRSGINHRLNKLIKIADELAQKSESAQEKK